jgi:hypothetical protein
MVKGHLSHVNAEEAQEAPDIVLVMFLVNSVPAMVLFDSRASHSFVTEPFVKKSGMTPEPLRRTMLVQIPGSTAKTKIACREIPLVIQGVTFQANLIVLGTQGLEVILGMDWMSKYRGIIDCARKSISLTSSEGVEVEYTAIIPSSRAYCRKSIAGPTLEKVLVVSE